MIMLTNDWKYGNKGEEFLMKEILKKIYLKYKWGYIAQILFIMLNIYFLTYPPKIIGNMIDLLYDIPGNKEQIILQTIYLLGISILLLVIRVIWKFFDTYLPRSLEMELKNRLFSQLLKLKLHSIQNKKNGELMSYFVKDINEMRAISSRIFSYGTRIVFTAIFATFAMIMNVDLKLTIYTMLPIIITTFLVVKIKNYVEISFRKAQDSFTELSEYIQESTDAIYTTKAYSQEKQQLKQFIKLNRKLRGNDNSVDVHSTLLTTVINICFGLCYGIALLYGSKLVLDNTITVGAFVAFNSYIGLFFGPVSWLPNVISRYKRAQISYARLDEIFQMEREKINTKTQKNSLMERKYYDGNIHIKDLTFHYPGYIETVLQHINLEINKGETLGIIGTVGCGKTTLMNLLTRLYSVERGQIFIDGIDINDIPIEELRENICYITQDNFLFSAKLSDNISLFKDQYIKEEIRESTQKAMIYDDIKKMPNEIDTVIGERGVDLSGGQKQRIVISRAFLKKSSILIFDDTFSALDNKTEQLLLENIKELAKEKTCILISNRISDVKIADKIIVLDAGQIVERGNHEELIEQQGRYYSFYKEQAIRTEDSILK